MKTWIKFMMVLGAGAYVAKRLKTIQQRTSKPVEMKDPHVSTHVYVRTTPSRLSNTLIQSFYVQVTAIMSTYPKDKTIDLVHRLTFNDFNHLHAFTQSHPHLTMEDDLDQLMVIIKEAIKTDVEMALEAIISMAELAEQHLATYQNFNLENLR